MMSTAPVNLEKKREQRKRERFLYLSGVCTDRIMLGYDSKNN